LKNPLLRQLVGGITAVTLGDAEAAKRSKLPSSSVAKKLALERQGEPTFGTVVEMISNARWRIYHNVGHVVDQLLLGAPVTVEERWQLPDGTMYACWVPVTHDSPDWLQLLQQE